MALETVVFPQDLFAYACNDLFPAARGNYGYDYESPRIELGTEIRANWDPFYSSPLESIEDLDANSSSMTVKEEAAAEAPVGRRKRRRVKSVKNREEIESQRMTHIAVERNRRRQMNEYLAVLRSLMPPSYAQRGDQASIVGGAINYVKELEQLLQSLEVQKRLKHQPEETESASPFATFFTFPQYSTSSGSGNGSGSSSSSSDHSPGYSSSSNTITVAESRPVMADVEVTMVESHANLKVMTRRQPKQLLRIVTGLQQLQLMPLHLNMTALDGMIMYSFSLKVEDESKFTSVDEIATAVYQMLGKIEDQANF